LPGDEVIDSDLDDSDDELRDDGDEGGDDGEIDIVFCVYDKVSSTSRSTPPEHVSGVFFRVTGIY
jgi:hypothetical protein